MDMNTHSPELCGGAIRGSHQQGFSLVELLVVVSIIAVLASMLLSAIGLVREQARSLNCQSSMHQVGLAIGAFGTDHDGAVVETSQPNATAGLSGPAYAWGVLWYELIQPYVERGTDDPDANIRHGVVWGCPVWRANAQSSERGRSGFGKNYLARTVVNDTALPLMDSYHMAEQWGGQWAIDTLYHAYQFSQITNIAQRTMIGDSVDWHLGAGYGSPTVWWNWSGDPRRHRNRANYLAFDMHVSSMAPDDAWSALYPPR